MNELPSVQIAQTPAVFDALFALAEGEALLGEWHDAVIRESWLDLPGKERALVERWRERTSAT